MHGFSTGDRVTVNIPGTGVDMAGTYVGPFGHMAVVGFDDNNEVARVDPANVTRAEYVVDADNPTDAELSAAITRGLISGEVITWEQFLAAR